MFALRRGYRANTLRLEKRIAALWRRAQGIILPRWLRRPTRLLARLNAGEIAIPRFTVGAMNAGLIAAASLYGAYVGGEMPEFVQGVTARTGFAVDQIKVVGNRETSEIDVLERLQLDGWTSLVGMDAADARDRIATLPWVSQVSVRKSYPNSIEVSLAERKPFAVWQHNNQLAVIEASGAVIAPIDDARHSKLPVVVGQGAELAAAAFIARVQVFPQLADRANVFIRVAERRWDIRFDSGVVAQLPEFGEDDALAELDQIVRENHVLDKDIVTVDMRLADRVVVRLTPQAVERREVDLKELSKPRKSKPEKRT